MKMKFLESSVAATPVDTAIELARKAIAVTTDDQARMTQLQVDRQAAVETGNVEALMKCNAQLEIAAHAAPKNAARAVEAITRIYQAAAEVERGLAEEKREKRASILTAIRKPLAELSLIEGVSYTRFITMAQPVGVWERCFGMTPPDFNECGPRDCRPGVSMVNPAPYAVPLSERLAGEIEKHEARAHELAERQVGSSGDLASTLEAVIREVMPPAQATAAEAA